MPQVNEFIWFNSMLKTNLFLFFTFTIISFFSSFSISFKHITTNKKNFFFMV